MPMPNRHAKDHARKLHFRNELSTAMFAVKLALFPNQVPEAFRKFPPFAFAEKHFLPFRFLCLPTGVKHLRDFGKAELLCGRFVRSNQPHLRPELDKLL